MVSTQIYWVSKEIDGKTLIFRVNLGMWPLKLIVSKKKKKNKLSPDGYNTHFWHF